MKAKKFEEYEQEQKEAIISFFGERGTYAEACAFFTDDNGMGPDYDNIGEIIDALTDDGPLTTVEEYRHCITGEYFSLTKLVLNTETE